MRYLSKPYTYQWFDVVHVESRVTHGALAKPRHLANVMRRCQPAHRPPMSGTASASVLAPSAPPRAAAEAAPMRTRQAVRYSCASEHSACAP